ncbi:choice-of-anchor Q domain-containing protein [uncultured Spirosoma sp.]|uniref:beta strand repeat-containing protein n=1 Tax=uncultured Spirosoma sp. TaxID=278208 RepID=UPI00262B8A5A|nr:choice-of-anchor Q domain-containing protein [uncultured Spirosoma sp.]
MKTLLYRKLNAFTPYTPSNRFVLLNIRNVLVFGLLLSWLASTTAFAQITRYVSTTGVSAPASATSWAASTTSLQGAIDYVATNGGGQVWVAAGVYKPTTTTGPDSRTISFAMKNGVAIYGGFVGNEQNISDRPTINPLTNNPSSTTLSGDIGTVGDKSDNSYHVIINIRLNYSAILDGFVITGGKADGNGFSIINDIGVTITKAYGGGIYSTSSTPQVTNCTIFDNSASIYGGGSFTEFGGIVITNSAFLNNSAGQYGGAVCNGPGSNNSPIINCHFLNNAAYWEGGAIYIGDSPPITNCFFKSNSATYGGAIKIDYSNSKVTNCAFQTNSATYGGAIYHDGNSMFINCSFQTNSSTYGGATHHNGSPSFTNCSFQGNTAPNGALMSTTSSRGRTAMNNCVVFNNGGASAINTPNSAGLTASYSLFDNTITSYTDGGNNLTTTTSPFASTASVALNACSPAINAGLNSATGLSGITTDLDGNPRFFNSGRVDMGAVEYQGNPGTAIAFTSTLASGSAVCVGSAVSVPVSVSGTVTGYQWYKEGNALTDQTAATLNLPAAQTTDQGSYSVVVTGACNSLTSTTFSLTVNPPPSLSLTNNGPLTCSLTSVTLTASTGSSAYHFSTGASQLGGSAGNTATVASPGIYSLTALNSSGCSAITSTTVTSMAALTLSAGASLPQANVGVTVSLSATGASAYQWTAPTTASFTTPANTSATSASLTTAGVQTFTVVGTTGACSQSAIVSLTALAGPDLSPLINMPSGNFAPGETKGMLIQLQEVNGGNATGNLLITITVPTGYSISFDNTLTSLNVSGGSSVNVQNPKWQISNTVASQQLSLRLNGGESVGPRSTMNIGVFVSRTSANGGSYSNITISVADDSGGTYDVNRLNNIYARIINGI